MVFGMPTTASGTRLRCASAAMAWAPLCVPSPPTVNSRLTPMLSRKSTTTAGSSGPREEPKTVPPSLWMDSTNSGVSRAAGNPRAGLRPQ